MAQELARTSPQPSQAAVDQSIQQRIEQITALNESLQREIAERVRVESELRRALQFQENVLELTTNAIAVLDLEGRLSQLNQWALELTGHVREDLEGRSFTVLVPPDKLPDIAARVRRTLAEGVSAYGVETDILRPDGTRRTICFNLAPIMEDGRVVGAVGTAEDETDRLRAQTALEKYACELERSNRELVQFAYVASHDLQEPLRVVAGYLQLLASQHGDTLPAEGQRYVQRAVAAVQRMHSLINDLLAYSRIGNRSVKRSSASLNHVLERVRENLAMSLQECQAQLDAEALPTVRADASQMVQLFQNLIGNALKFRSAETPVIRLTATREERAWRIGVQDNGIGIPAEHADRVFQIFQRLHTRAEFPGNGIGLAICKKIVEGHDGRIWIEPVVPHGSLVQFVIPDPQEEK